MLKSKQYGFDKALNEVLLNDNFKSWLCSVPGTYLDKAFKELNYVNLGFSKFSFMVMPSENMGSITKMKIRVFAFIGFKGTDNKDHYLLFYTSSGSGGKIETNHGSWYPIFGTAKNLWLVKTKGKDLALLIDGKSAPYGNLKLGLIKDYLDKKFPILKLLDRWELNIKHLYSWVKTKYPDFFDKSFPDRMKILHNCKFYNVLLNGNVIYGGDYEFNGNMFYPEYRLSMGFDNDLYDICYKILNWYSDLEFKELPVLNNKDITNIYKRKDKILNVL